MADVVNRTTNEVRRSVNTPDYDVKDWLVNPDNLDWWLTIEEIWRVVDGDTLREMTSQEKEDDIDTYRQQEGQQLAKEANAYLASRYDPTTQSRLQNEYTQARLNGLTNREMYLNQVNLWSDSVFDYYDSELASIEAATTVDEIATLTNWDFAQFDATDPNVTVTEARRIKD